MAAVLETAHAQADRAVGLRNPFPGAGAIERSHSQAWQDIFVLSMLGGKRGGRYLEIGAQLPVANNNTVLLHRQFGWNGISVEIDPRHYPAWRNERPESVFVIADALRLDWPAAMRTWFGDERCIDYLQLDIDPAAQTLQVLDQLPLDEWRFRTITFETDAYTGDLHARDASRALLASHGYQLVLPDVTVIYPPVSLDPIAFEDWWVDPAAVDAAALARFRKAHAKGDPCHMLFGMPGEEELQ